MATINEIMQKYGYQQRTGSLLENEEYRKYLQKLKRSNIIYVFCLGGNVNGFNFNDGVKRFKCFGSSR